MSRLKEKNNHIQFELKESLSFEKGQEISEMISISLDPDVVIQAYEAYVHIRGVILLQGEYHRDFEGKTDEDEKDKRKSVTFIEKVHQAEEDIAIFSHRFPIDISVAKERVQDINKVYMTVEAFDYELPSTDLLKVHAALNIFGIAEDESTLSEIKQDRAVEEEVALTTDDEGVVEAEQADQAPHEKKEALKQEQEIENSTLPDEAVVDEAEWSADIEEASLHEKHEETSLTHQQIEEVEHEEIEEEKEEIEIELAKGEEAVDDQAEDVTFLTGLFEETEEMYTQVTIYIAQADDTIESIAKRYNMPVLQILKDNDLAADTIEAGQLITIRKQRLSEA